MNISKNSNPYQLMQLSEKDLMEIMLPSKRMTPKTKAGSSTEKKKLTFIPIDQEALKEILLDPSPAAHQKVSSWKGLQRDSIANKRQSGSSSVYKMKRTSTISRRSTDKKTIEKAVTNITKVSSKTSQNNGDCELIPMPKNMYDILNNYTTKPNVRKELFKKSSTEQTTKTSQSGYNQKYFKPPRMSNFNSPLLNLDKLASSSKKKSLLKSSEKHVTLSQTPRLSTVREEISITPSRSGGTDILDSSSTEFETMERMCNGEETKGVHDKLNKILSIMETDKREFEKFKEAKERRMLEITTILKEIISSEEQNDEKGQRLTKLRTPKKTPVKSEKMSSKKDDLRRNVLLTSLGKSLGNTPKQTRAENMYNSLRDKYSVLETPKFNKTANGEETGNISLKLQQQCLMLMDTPKHK